MEAIKVKKQDAEKARKFLMKENYINNRYKIKKSGSHILFPIKKITKKIKAKFKIVEKELEEINKKEKNLIDILYGKLSKEFLDNLPKSMDIIGDIAIVEIPDNLKGKEAIIGNAILKLHKNLKVVAKKAGLYSGEFRVRKLKIIAGENRKETLHKENYIKLKVNPETCYFSPRLATERHRIFNQVKPKENILVMFSGVGPYPISIAKNSNAKNIIGIEINPKAHKYAEQNIELNKIKNVKVYLGDVKDIVPKLKEKFDRIIMPLPKTADTFLAAALAVAKKGTIIHLYDFLHETEIPDKAIKKIKRYVKKFKILEVVKCGQYSPGKYRICIDFKLS
ncbi:MAG: class I SAM-dependent methyltransferase family protein [Nanoarchaeota archaeon]|nr:class I SAM-dependent methyltransferase family protein [Nanoarchaeota archaeon]